ncbi:hypothetical protein [Halorubrum sp. Ea8]
MVTLLALLLATGLLTRRQ